MTVPAVARLLIFLFPAFGSTQPAPGIRPAETGYLLPGRQIDGNRHYPGELSLSRRASAALPDSPAWVVGFQDARGRPQWYVETSDGRLEIVSETAGFSSHRLGSPNLGQGILVDTTGDGYPEVILPDQRQTSLRVLQRTPGAMTEIARLPLPSRLVGNLSIASPPAPGGSPALLAGSEDGSITVWH